MASNGSTEANEKAQAPAQAPNQPRAKTKQAEEALAFSVEAARLCADSRCTDVQVLDVQGLSNVCDYFVIATAVSSRQMRAIGTDIEDLAREHDFTVIGNNIRGPGEEQWVVVDLVDVVVHLFSPEARLYYDLETLWGDAKPVKWTREEAPKA